MKIIGAGMAGLLAGQHFRSLAPKIFEKQKSLPNNHKALLRFRSKVVSDMTGIDFRKVQVHKMMNYEGEHFTESNLRFNNMYSQKVTGGAYPRSAIDLSPVDRFIAPENFIARVSTGLEISYTADGEDVIRNQMIQNSPPPLISTMPIAKLAKILCYDLYARLETKPIWTTTFYVESTDVYQTVYYPNPDLPLYRMSITGDKVIAEFTCNPVEHWGSQAKMNIYHFLERDFAITGEPSRPVTSHQEHGKIVPCDREEIRKFMGWATREYNIYSLGRWATHRQVLMDDVAKDLKVISKLIKSQGYNV